MVEIMEFGDGSDTKGISYMTKNCMLMLTEVLGNTIQKGKSSTCAQKSGDCK